MEEITIEELMKKAKTFQKQGKKWHFHMLTPDCMFNKRKDKHSFVLENETNQENFVVYSDKRYMEQGKELVKLIYGESILKAQTVDKPPSKNLKIMLEKADRFNSKGILWHHHMLFPNCIFNKHKGKWVIFFEDPEENKVIESVTDEEPIEDLRKIEIPYYKQKK